MALEEKKDPQPPRDWLVAFGKGIRTPSLQQGINFSSTQLDVMLRVIKKFDEYDGLILKAYMGAGKTFMSMAIMNYIRETLGDKRGIVVICPDKLVDQWQTDWMSEDGEPQSYKSHNEIWSFTDWVKWSSRHQPTAQSSWRPSFSGSGQADEGSESRI